ELLAELPKETVELRPTYDGTGKEPEVLPARFPHLLVNGSTGIAVGMATNIPPHNLGEVVRAAVLMIDHMPPAKEDEAAAEKRRKAALKEVVKIVKGPDFPTGGRLVGTRKELAAMYEEGR